MFFPLDVKNIQLKAELWEAEKTELLKIVKKFWLKEVAFFKLFWISEESIDLRSAIVITALEDLPVLI